MKHQTLVLHRSKLLLPVSQPAIDDGGAVVAGGRIVDVGSFQALRRQWPGARLVDHGEAAVLPALVNAHTHLELSGVAASVEAKGGMAAWIRSLLAAREGLTAVEMEEARRRALASMLAAGTGIVADISSCGVSLPARGTTVPLQRCFLEVLGLQASSLEAALGVFPAAARQALANGSSGLSLAAHAPYTTSAALLRQVKAWGLQRGKTVSVHAAESQEEILFLQTGKGPLRDLLAERGMAPERWQPPGCGSVAYLERLGFLDPLTLLVHVIQVGEEEIDLLSRSGTGVCLCPRSNLYLGHGLPPVGRLLARGVRCALGTDSLASNTDLNLFKEMAVLLECGIDPPTVLEMATMNGARHLGVGALYGSLEKGKVWLAIRIGASEAEAIIAAGCGGAVRWLT